MPKTCNTCKLIKEECEFYKKQGKCKDCFLKKQIELRKVQKKRAVDLLGGKCTGCGYDKSLAALDFHHTDPEKKYYKVGDLLKRNSWEEIKQEVLKCQLLCANCHREHHASEE